MSLSSFHPRVAEWFSSSFGEPTEIQTLAWPRIATGEHVLITAPTGSGKTLAAFLWSLDRLLSGAWTGSGVDVLYVSPLRALNNDIRRNLLRPLAELEAHFAAADEPVRRVRVATRSGDTASAERQRMVRHPPEILITTPESLNILLTSKGGRSMLGALRCVILDEIHATADTKRGTHLITAVERLTLLSGEFQRIALSATVRPEAAIARFIGGRRMVAVPDGGDPVYERRPVQIVASSARKRYALEVVSHLLARGAEEVDSTSAKSIWEPLVGDLRSVIAGNRSTLVFANSRRVTEKVTRLLNEGQPTELAYSHHGSLSREIRTVVEERLKEGRLAAIVATSSLELGIDIGVLDEVILLRTPPSIAATVQRLGRAGHAVGETSRGRFYPLFERDLLEAVAVREAVEAQDVEEIRPVAAPLDVLAQVIVSMVASESWRIDDLYRFVRTAQPYHQLSRRHFDLVLEMLAGRYADSRIRELRPRVRIDRVEGVIRARPGAARLVYSSGGTIPDRGYFHLRLRGTRAKLGELDEEFVWERSVGDTFALGAQSWKITGITHNDVLVEPAIRGSAMAPFWRAEERNRSFHLSERIGALLEHAERRLSTENGTGRLGDELRAGGLGDRATADLLRFLEAQRAATGKALPHRHHLLIERSAKREDELGRQSVILHTFWGGRVNRPLALALSALWEQENGEPLDIEQDNDSLLLLLPTGADPIRLLRRIHPDNVERLLRDRLEESGFFGARFRESAGRALLLPRGDFRRRVPLWFNRQRSKKLLGAVQRYGDFPILLETWRTCLQDEFDLENLVRVLAEVESGEIAWSETTVESASPFSADVVWKQTNRLMYEDDEPERAAGGSLRRDLLRELVLGSQLRPRLPTTIVDRLERKLKRVHPGYAPQSAEDLAEWVRERVLLPRGEWVELLEAAGRDLELDSGELEEIVDRASPYLVEGGFSKDGDLSHVVHIEQLDRVERLLGFVEARSSRAADEREQESGGPELVSRKVPAPPFGGRHRPSTPDPLEELVAEWIRFYGPFRKSLLSEHLNLREAELEGVLESLVADERIVIDHFRQGLTESDELEICDTENLERLLRLLRAESRPAFVARPIGQLAGFLAAQQGLAAAAGDKRDLMAVLETLFTYPAPVRFWESELLPARLDPYYTRWMDHLFHDTDLMWLGSGNEQISLLLRSDLDLVDSPSLEEDQRAALERIFPKEPGRFAIEELARRSGWEVAEIERRLWQLAWSGAVSNTTFQTLRAGAHARFRPPQIASEGAARGAGAMGRRGVGRRGRFERWKPSRLAQGDWWVVDAHAETGPEDLDALDREELNKDRVRLLLERYGLLFRELLLRERSEFQWARLFRTLRLMELSGEVLSGQFFNGIPGLQFISPTAFRRLQEQPVQDVVYWLNAADPASVCGLGLDELKGRLPSRRRSSHLVYHGDRLVVVSRRSGAALEIDASPEHPDLPRYLGFLGHLLTREFAPRRSITVETINGEPAVGSAWVEALAERFDTTREPAGVKLRRRF